VSGIAAEHGGNVAVANADGGGAVFTLTLPLNGEGRFPADSDIAPSLV
jgi:signal transduction histidine kinase